MVAINQSAQDIICNSIKERIQSGELQPGMELKQVKLAKTYGVSRMPVREALQSLMLEGVVVRLQNRHMVIANPSSDKSVQQTEKQPGTTVPVYPVEKAAFGAAPGKIHLLPAREQVASYLRKAILRREIPEGSVLTLEETAKSMGVSSTPVREALQLLATQGLVKLRPNKGAVVLGLNEKAIRDHFFVRSILETEAAVLAARPGSNLTQVEKVFGAMEKCMVTHNYREYTHYNESFHVAIWEAADNPKLTQILGGLWNGLSLGFLASENEYAQVSFKEHKQLMQALRRHDEKRVRELMHQHMERSMNDILTNYREQGISEK